MMSLPVPGITQMGGNPQYPNFGVQTGMPQGGGLPPGVQPGSFQARQFRNGRGMYGAPQPGAQGMPFDNLQNGQMPPWMMNNPMFQPGGQLYDWFGPPQGGPQSLPIPGSQMPGQRLGQMDREGMGMGRGLGRGGRVGGRMGGGMPPMPYGNDMMPQPMPPGGGMQSLPIPGSQSMPQSPMMSMPQFGRYGGG